MDDKIRYYFSISIFVHKYFKSLSFSHDPSTFIKI